MAQERRRLPAELAKIAEERGDDGQPVRSPRTLARWRKHGPPPDIKSLLTTEAGRNLLTLWIDQYSDQAA